MLKQQMDQEWEVRLKELTEKFDQTMERKGAKRGKGDDSKVGENLFSTTRAKEVNNMQGYMGASSYVCVFCQN